MSNISLSLKDNINIIFDKKFNIYVIIYLDNILIYINNMDITHIKDI